MDDQTLQLAVTGKPRRGRYPLAILQDGRVLVTGEVNPHKQTEVDAFLKLAGEKLPGLNGRGELLRDELLQLAAPKPDRAEGDADGRPVIQVNNRQLRDITADVMRALQDANNPAPVLFRRSGAIVRIKTDEHGRHLIDNVNESSARWRIARCCNCVKVTEEGPKHVSPTDDVVRDVLAQPGNWPFPTLEAVTEIPTLRPDGSILSEPGYDPATKVFYAPRPELKVPPIPAEPGMEEAADAVDLLREALADFPFVDDASLANTIALLITPALRTATDGNVPLGIIDAPTPGTGKGLLAELIAFINTGIAAALMTAPRDEAEWKKLITSTLTGGPTLILIDNVEDPLGSPHLASVLTARVWRDRILGRSEMITIPQRATWLANGNNVQLAGDLPRRCYWIRLDAKLSRPWQGRTFRHPDLMAWAEENRGRLVAAILTMCRAWWVAGRPAAKSPVIGGFEEWSRTVAGILNFAGVPGFLGNLADLYEGNDQESSGWEAFLSAWLDRFPSQSVTVATLASAIVESSALKEALPDDLSESLVREPAKFKLRIGHALRKRVQRRYGSEGLYVDRAEDDSHSKVARWQVQKAGDAGICGDCFNPSRGNSISTQDLKTEFSAKGLEVSPQTPASPATPEPADLPW